jgi:hypothetical protein
VNSPVTKKSNDVTKYGNASNYGHFSSINNFHDTLYDFEENSQNVVKTNQNYMGRVV